ncbi:MAG TPA: hypothetical protein VGM43_13660 [Bryobacteraceae bacterium]|jgi:hypothetical protein
MLSVGDALESAGIGISLSVFGTYLYSRRKGAEALDEARAVEELRLRQEIAETKIRADTEASNLRSALATATSDRAKDHHYQQVKPLIHNLSPNGMIVLRHLWAHSPLETNMGGNVEAPGLNARDTRTVLDGELRPLPFVKFKERQEASRVRYSWEIADGYRDALKELLF